MKYGEAEIEIESTYNNLSIIRDFARSYFEVENIAEHDRIKLISAIDELATNVVEHAYNDKDSDKVIKIVLKKKEKCIYAVVEDYGNGFSKDKKSKDEGGFGLKIVEGIVDAIKIITKDRGTKVEIEKRVEQEETKNA